MGTSRRGTIAVVDDEPLVLRALERILAPCRWPIETATDLGGLRARLRDPSLAVVLLDLFVGEASGLEGLDLTRRERPDVEVVMMTGRGSIESAVRCMRAGAFDYLCKPFTDAACVRETVRAAREAALGGGIGDAPAAEAPATPIGWPSDWLRVPLVAPPASDEAEVPLSLEAYERLALERALRESAGDARAAARRLGIGRSTFYRRAAKLGVDLRRGDEGATVQGGAGSSGRPERVGRGPSIR